MANSLPVNSLLGLHRTNNNDKNYSKNRNENNTNMNDEKIKCQTLFSYKASNSQQVDIYWHIGISHLNMTNKSSIT